MVSATLGEGFSLAFPPAKAIVTGISVLLSAAKGVKASHDALIDLFGRIEDFFKRFKIYIQSSPTAEWGEVLVRVVAEVLYILSIATKEMEQSKAKKYFKRLLGRTDIEDALRKLDSLIQGENGMVTAQILKATSELKDDVEKIVAAIQQMQKIAGEEEWKQIRKDARRWFSPPDPSTNHNIAWKAYHEGTATWFFEGSVFVDWMSIGSLLWVHGKPGSGKSILCSAIIQHIMALYEPGQATLLYYYFDFRNEEKKNARNLMTSLLVQLSAFSDPCCDVISNLFLTHGKGTRKPTDDALTKCLKQMLSVIAEHPTYIIMDALDECPDDSGWPKTARAEVLRVVKDLVGLHFPNLRICVTSRPEVDVKSILDQLTIHAVSLHDESEQQEGIADYVSTIVNSDEKMREWPDEDKELVVKVLSERADGMFRWVVCQLETLRRSAQRNVRGILEKLPKTLDETYERVLKEINEDNREHARRLLHCLAVAVRPLRVEELAEILAFDFNARAQGGIPECHAGWQRKDQERAVLFTCSSLITVVDGHIHDEEDDEEDDSNDSRVFRLVQFSHFSVKEFLMSNRLASSTRGVSQYHILPGSAHTILAQACLGILLRLDNPDHTRNVNDFPLTEYAAQHWVTHAQFENVASRVKDGMESLFDPDKPHFTAWVNIYNIDGVILWKSFQRYETQIPTPLYYSALCGFHDLAKHLLFKDPQHARAIGGTFDSPLLAALYGKHIRVAELLLKNGGNINARGTDGQTPLFQLFNDESYRYNDDDYVLVVAKLLLERGADVNLTDEYHQTPLLLAVRSMRYDVARLLLQHGANEKVEDDKGSGPLHQLIRFRDSSSRGYCWSAAWK